MAGTGFFSNKKGIKEAKEAAGAIQYAGAQAIENVNAAKAQAQAAEEAKFKIFGLLGSEGSYGPGSPQATLEDWNPDNSVFDTSNTGLSQPDQNLRQSVPYSLGGNAMLDKARQGIIDPDKYAAAVSKTSAFKQQSQRVAESESLLAKEGPEWDKLENSTIGAIDQGAATMLRDTLRELKNQHAKGGSARREALNNFNIILAEERAMSERIEGTWKANIALYDMVRKNHDATMEGTAYFLGNLPLINDNYRTSIAHAASMSIQAGAVAAAASQNAYAVKQSQQAVHFGAKFGEALVGAVVSMIPYVGAVLGAAVKQAGAGGGYQAVGTTATGSSAGYGGGVPTSAIQATIASFGQKGGGSGMLSTEQVGQAWGAVKSGAASAWGSISSGASGAWQGVTSFFGSDVRFKDNIEYAGMSNNGHKLYTFNYKTDPDNTYLGVLAHEVIETNPEAVEVFDGYYYVDYNKIGLELRIL